MTSGGKYRILTTSDRTEWDDLLIRFAEADIYFTRRYHALHEANGDGQALLYVFADADDLIIYPFMLRPIDYIGEFTPEETYYDIETVYGYSGPLASTEDVGFIRAAWSSFGKYCTEKGIIAEFLRFNPLSANHRFVDSTCDVIHDRETAVINLDCTKDELWAAYPSVNRNMIRKALKAGLSVDISSLKDDINTFRRLYEANMTRQSAVKYYFFSDDYYQALINSHQDDLLVLSTKSGDQTAAMSLFFLYKDRMHYHLSAGNEKFRSLAPTNLLLHAAAEWGQDHGFAWLHLGGGRTPDPHDSLLKFKTTVSKKQLPFYIGKRIHNLNVYERLCSSWMKKQKRTERPQYFLMYRLENNL